MNILDNQTCLVTGASRGIGRAIAIALGKSGATVIGSATSESGASDISEYLVKEGINGQGVTLNVTNNDSVADVLAHINESYGSPSVLVNNAGITRDNLLIRMKENEWDEVMDTDLKSIYRVTKACLRGMTKARYGRVINITSVVGVSGNPGQANYCAAKAGVIGFTKSLALEVGNRGITVNAVAPGFIDTDMTRALSEEQRQQILSRIPLGKLGQVEDIAQAVLYLASPAGDYVTGVTLHINGGMYLP